ncbi:unnamed protein product [Notodromas monacha]|uniref:Uncharacterized protein n=1 Tax=Notodromas monacha TaxID=399045 RepID=A0A7R9BBY5_9CRUS|nr:unnamed protein product [Notodromas monacha]CAG0912384.1 unnamed protein product [Notodromas monacha]
MAASSKSESTSHGGVLVYMFPAPPSADVGMENPFRPDGELSREADAIVERIREGKPLTPTGTAERADVCDAGGVPTSREPGPAPTAPPCESEQVSRVDAAPPSLDSPISSKSQCLSRTGANGNSSGPNQPTSVEVQRSVVGSPAQQAERVVIKKSKTKNKCCVIQ